MSSHLRTSHTSSDRLGSASLAIATSRAVVVAAATAVLSISTTGCGSAPEPTSSPGGSDVYTAGYSPFPGARAAPPRSADQQLGWPHESMRASISERNAIDRARAKAAEYTRLEPMTRQALVDKLIGDGFTKAQAEAGAASQF